MSTPGVPKRLSSPGGSRSAQVKPGLPQHWDCPHEGIVRSPGLATSPVSRAAWSRLLAAPTSHLPGRGFLCLPLVRGHWCWTEGPSAPARCVLVKPGPQRSKVDGWAASARGGLPSCSGARVAQPRRPVKQTLSTGPPSCRPARLTLGPRPWRSSNAAGFLEPS